MRDQKSDRAHPLRQPQLDAAVHVPGRERILVADHDDPAADGVRVPLEILRPAQSEIEDFRHQAGRRRRAEKRRACRRRARRCRRSLAPFGTANPDSPRVLANPCARHGGQPLPGERQTAASLAEPARRPAQIAQRLEVRPHQWVAGIYRRGEPPRRCGVRHGVLIPTDLTISAQRAVSLSIRARNCAGDAPDLATPSGTRRVANSGESENGTGSLVRRAAISGGRPAGASTPHQCSTTRSMPPSLNVGILACVANRVSLAIASARTRSKTEAAVASVVKPDYVTGDQIVHGWPGAAKRHMHELDADFGLKSSAVRWVALPIREAMVIFSGWLSRARRSPGWSPPSPPD